MSKTSAQADSITMSGGGIYSLATIGAKDVIDHATQLVVDAIKNSLENHSKSSFRMTDMGCADGGTSLNMVRQSLQIIQELKPGLPVEITYADQPRNDYNALVKIIYGLTQFDSYLEQFPQVFPLFSGTSFYRQILPDNQLDLGFSATAMHWLSRKPCNISDHVHAVGASGEELKAFSKQGAEDWKTILLHRARELRSGGHLVLVNFCQDEKGRYLGNTGGINMFDHLNEIWRSFVNDNVITEEEYVGMTLPQYYNNVEEFSAPLKDQHSEVYKAGLRLEHIETRVVPCPFAQAFKQHRDAGKFAKEYIPTIRTWNESIYYAGLSSDRAEQERREIIHNYYKTYEDQVAANPEGHAMDYVHAYTVIRKE